MTGGPDLDLHYIFLINISVFKILINLAMHYWCEILSQNIVLNCVG